MNTPGLSRRQDARNNHETGIPLFLLWFGVVAGALILCAFVGLVVIAERGDGQSAARASLEQDAAQLGRQYALARATASLAAKRWATQLDVGKFSSGPTTTELADLSVDATDVLSITNDRQALVALRGMDAIEFEKELGPMVREHDIEFRFATLDRRTYLIVSEPMKRGRTLHVAFDLDARAALWNGQRPPTLTVSGRELPALSPDSLQVILDQNETQTLSVTHAIPTLWLHSSTWLWRLGLLGLALLGALYWLWNLALRLTLARYWNGQLQPLTMAIRRIRDGNLAVPLITHPGHALYRVAGDFNAMLDELDDRQNEVDFQSQFDALTGLTTRAVANERIARAVDRATVANHHLAAVAIDVSRFNEINGTLGQDVGDMVLKTLAQRLTANTRVTDTVARVGGDEFMLLLDDVDERTAAQLVEFLVSTLEAPIVVNDKTVNLQIRAGLALYPDHCDGPKALRRMANIALMTAKQSKQKAVTYEAGQDEQHLRELAIIHDLPGAIRDGELYLQYQPKIDMESQRVETVEALVRWRHPQLGFIPPDEFIGLLEKGGQISQLTDWVFKAAIKQCRDWMTAGYELGIAVNISANDLRDEKLPERICDLLHHYVVSPSRISIEVTESAVIDDPERAVAVLQAFKRAGLKIALDDFGTGQTSLSLLKQLPLSQIKIDKSFVQHLRADSGDAIIVKSIIDLGHNMGLLVTAEGVESNYCWNLLNSYGCDLVQGYLVSAPLTSEELCQWYLRLQERHVHKLDYSFLQDAG